MKKNLIITVLVLSLAVFAGILLSWLDKRQEPVQVVAVTSSEAAEQSGEGSQAEPPRDEGGSASEAVGTDSAEPSGYYLTEYNGRLAVIKVGESVPEIIFEVYIQTLPEYDRQLLYNGIFVESEEELNRLIEDYIS